MKGFLLGFLCLILIGAGAAGLLYFLNTSPTFIPEKGSVFKIVKGENLNITAVRLEQNRLIRSAILLRLLSRFNYTAGSIKSGYYRIMPGQTTVEIHNLLVAGYQEVVKVTFPEGWTISKMAQHLEDKEIAPKEEVVAAGKSKALLAFFDIPAENLEGYLFPDTYYFPKGYPAYAVVERMVENFFSRLKEIIPDYRSWDKKELHNTVILASIVEREYRIDTEAPLIASVFLNRLKYNIGLESCATLEYIITEVEKKPHPEYLTLADTEIDSPFNTYKWAGLPPGAISNPGKVALTAALKPPETDYMYFLLKNPSTGEHYFSVDLEEHNQAKYFYLKQVGSGG